MKDTPTTIILSGGPINYTSLPIGTTQSNGMVPVNGKPVISWILDDLIEKGIDDVVVVVREQDQRLRNFLRRAYTGRMTVRVCPLSQEGTIVQSLWAGLRFDPTSGLVRVILGDTLIRDSYDSDEDFVYVAEVEDSRRWCLAFTNPLGEISDYADKQDVDVEPKMALAGYYHFTNGEYLHTCIERTISYGETQLSSILRHYGARHPIHAHEVQEWHDFGNIDNLLRARRELLRPRHFNSLKIDPTLNTITKVSENDQKLRDELNWYLQLPEELKVLTPRIVSHREENDQIHIVQEYYGYPTLAELYVYGDVNPDTWRSIMKHVFRVHELFRQYGGYLDPEDLQKIYLDKTWKRLDTLREQSAEWAEILSYEVITYNGQSYRNIDSLREAICERGQELMNTAQGSITHGDMCFSNILFDINHQIIRLIDPRGEFGRKGIYGDPRYDIAKLRHSVVGVYDFIVADMFEVSQDEGGAFKGAVYSNGTSRIVSTMFDRMVAAAGYDLNQIRFIEGLLFTSMVPLHKDKPLRQKMMYLTGIKLLNEVL